MNCLSSPLKERILVHAYYHQHIPWFTSLSNISIYLSNRSAWTWQGTSHSKSAILHFSHKKGLHELFSNRTYEQAGWMPETTSDKLLSQKWQFINVTNNSQE